VEILRSIATHYSRFNRYSPLAGGPGFSQLVDCPGSGETLNFP
jgi:hypothetical protein